MRSGIQSLPGQIPTQLNDQLGSGCWGRRRLAVRPPRAELERRLTLDAVAGDQTAHPTRRHVVAAGSLANSPALYDNSGNDQAGLRHPETQAGLCFLCLATCVSYVVNRTPPRAPVEPLLTSGSMESAAGPESPGWHRLSSEALAWHGLSSDGAPMAA
jgi:hypothetical protein